MTEVGRDEGEEDETTPVVARRIVRCVPCLGTGRLRLSGVELYETRRPCPYCRGSGSRIIVAPRPAKGARPR
jgi:hypothetical protein